MKAVNVKMPPVESRRMAQVGFTNSFSTEPELHATAQLVVIIGQGLFTHNSL